MEERWEIIKSNPDYLISDFGRVKNKSTGKILKATLHGRPSEWYLRIELKNPRRKYLVHRLVAEAFIPNPLVLDQINHKDEDGTNNVHNNLEWCTGDYNIQYSQLKEVLQKSKQGIIIREFKSLTDAALYTGSDIRLVSAVCLGKRKTHNGFIWEYKNTADLLTKRRKNGRLVA